MPDPVLGTIDTGILLSLSVNETQMGFVPFSHTPVNLSNFVLGHSCRAKSQFNFLLAPEGMGIQATDNLRSSTKPSISN